MEDLAPDFDVGDLVGDLAGVPEPATDAGDRGPELDEADREAGWRIKERKAEPAAEPETIDAVLERTFDEKAAGAADDSAWQREQRRLADEALRRAGVDPSERHTHGLSRREVVRRLFAAEAMLRDNPAHGLSFIANAYSQGWTPEQRAEVAQHVLRSFGIESPQALAEQDARELAEYRQQQTQLRQALAHAETRARTMLGDFAAKHPDFEQHRRVMAAMLQSGAAADLQSAYKLARQAAGQPTADAERAQAEAERRRQEVAKAKAAGTPQTKSAPTRAVERRNNSDKTIEQLLTEAYDAMAGG